MTPKCGKCGKDIPVPGTWRYETPQGTVIVLYCMACGAVFAAVRPMPAQP